MKKYLTNKEKNQLLQLFLNYGSIKQTDDGFYFWKMKPLVLGNQNINSDYINLITKAKNIFNKSIINYDVSFNKDISLDDITLLSCNIPKIKKN